MKRINLFLLLVILSLSAFAQYPVHSEFGIKAGVNFANVEYNNASMNGRTAYHFGILDHIHLSRSWAVEPEVVYSSQGYKPTSNTQWITNYVNIPVLAQYMFGEGFRLETGPQLGILASAKYKNASGDENEALKNDLKGIDFGWAFGASYITRSGVGISGRYNLGISDITQSTQNEVENRVWQVGLFYQFKH